MPGGSQPLSDFIGAASMNTGLATYRAIIALGPLLGSRLPSFTSVAELTARYGRVVVSLPGRPEDQSASTRPYQGLPDIDYPFHDKVGRRQLRQDLFRSQKDNFSTVCAGQAVGIKEVHEDIWLDSLMDCDLGYFDLETRVLEPLDNPLGPRVVTHVNGTLCNRCVRAGPVSDPTNRVTERTRHSGYTFSPFGRGCGMRDDM